MTDDDPAPESGPEDAHDPATATEAPPDRGRENARTATTTDDPLATMRAAIAEVRREGQKAALLYAVVDGVLVALAANLLVALSGVPALVAPVSLPGDALGGAAVPVGSIPAVALGVVAAAAEFGLRTRRPLVERFEEVNPAVHEALRTARDAAEDGNVSPMAAALYADVVDRLGETSSLALVRVRRLGLAIVLVVALSVVTIQLAVLGIDVGEIGDPGGNGGSGGGGPPQATPTPGGLQPGDDVLGERETVAPGSVNLSAEVTYDEGGGGRGDDVERDYGTGGFAGGTTVAAERAGFAPPGELEDAKLIKEYSVAIREAES